MEKVSSENHKFAKYLMFSFYSNYHYFLFASKTLATETCDDTCVEGCNCPDGKTLNDEGECIPTSQCPCLFDGKEFQPGFEAMFESEIWLVFIDFFSLSFIIISSFFPCETSV